MKFDNLLSQSQYRVALKNALADWMLCFDGNDFATGNVLQCIPWNGDLNAVLPWDDVDYDFDTAIGSRGNWCRREIVVNNEDGENLRRKFWAEVDRKCAAICEVYKKSIDNANAIVAKIKEG
jgi:hypothetical protein